MSMSVSHLDWQNTDNQHSTSNITYPHHHTGTCSYQPLAFQKPFDPNLARSGLYWTKLPGQQGKNDGPMLDSMPLVSTFSTSSPPQHPRDLRGILSRLYTSPLYKTAAMIDSSGVVVDTGTSFNHHVPDARSSPSTPSPKTWF
jgi:hypothetical protein